MNSQKLYPRRISWTRAFGRRNELAEDGARRIVHESAKARRRYHSELESAVQHIQAQHHEAHETAEQFRVQRETLQQECLSYAAEREEMYGQEMEAISDWHPTRR